MGLLRLNMGLLTLGGPVTEPQRGELFIPNTSKETAMHRAGMYP